jgi:acetyl-CoA synthetase
LPAVIEQELIDILGEKVNVANPLDYHTYIWGDIAASTAAFTGLLKTNFAVHLLVLDYPRLDRCKADSWETTLSAYIQAAKNTGQMACIVSSMPEGLPESLTTRLMQEGLAPMMGLEECIEAIACAVKISQARLQVQQIQILNPIALQSDGAPQTVYTWDEVQSKKALAALGLPIPTAKQLSLTQARLFATELENNSHLKTANGSAAKASMHYPVVVKAVSSQLAHKTEAGAVKLNIKNSSELLTALEQMAHLSDQFLIEEMAQNMVAEIIVGVTQDPQFGPSLTIGAGGILVEILKDSKTLLLPTNPQEVEKALMSLRMAPLLKGYRGKPATSITQVVNAILSIAQFAQQNAHHLQELDVNPLMALADTGHSSKCVVAVDALIRSNQAAL